MNNKERIIWIDYLKAFACFLVLYGHLIQSLKSIDPIFNINSYVNYFIYLFHMPLFICISGILYYKFRKKFNWKNYKIFELNKILNLLVPYFTFYILYMILNTIFQDSVNTAKGLNEWLGIINNPIAPYWFLYALLSLFIFIPIIDYIFKDDKNKSFILLFLLKICSIYIKTKIYFIDSIMSYGLYFYFGRFISTIKNDNNKFYKLKSGGGY